MFDQKVQEELKAYVYRLVDPRTSKTFYVGKGNGNRCFSHAKAALGKSEEKSAKLDLIREMHEAGISPAIIIHRHGMNDDEAFEVEGALIDAYLDLTNEVAGHHRGRRGVMTTDEVISLYAAKRAVIREPAILIKINQLWPNLRKLRIEGGSEEEFQDQLYFATRHCWRVGKQRERAKYAVSVAYGIIRQVYEIDRWLPVKMEDGKTRYEFEGRIAEDMAYLLNQSVSDDFDIGAKNPIKYLNCG